MSKENRHITENERAMALLNILEDFNQEKTQLENSQKALLNILEDFSDEKEKLANTEKAVVNILDDYRLEKERIELMNNELEDARDKLEERVEDRTAELKQSNDELESFSYSVSHDLRAPLRAIIGYSEILKEDYEDNLDDAGKKVIQTIIKNASKMSRLIDDILAFSRLGRQTLALEKINMNDLVESVYNELTAGIEERTIVLKNNVVEEARGDKVMITQLVTNLVSNAVKYTKEKDDAVIEFGAKMTDNGYAYYVKDNGAGFNMDYKNKLFGVFQRLHSAKTFEGTGVGLAIAKRIVDHHRGAIWANSQVNEFATFYFTLKV